MVPLMSESMDRRLGVFEYLALRLHLLVCAWCARYLKQIKFIGSLTRKMSANVADNTPSSALNAEARKRIAETLRQAK
jgi:hypothetical protein